MPRPCDLAIPQSTYQPFERIHLATADFESLEINTESNTPVLVFQDDIGPFFFAPIENPGALSVRIDDKLSCNIELDIADLDNSSENIGPLVGHLGAIHQILTTNIGATGNFERSELNGDISQADYALAVMRIRQEEFEAMVDTLTPAEKGQLGALFKASGLDEIIAGMTTAPGINALWIPTEYELISSAQTLSEQMISAAHFCTVTRSKGPEIATQAKQISGVGNGRRSISQVMIG